MPNESTTVPEKNSVADLVVGGHDDLGDVIKAIYGRSAPDYAVYRTWKGVRVQYSDDRATATDQRSRMVQLNPVRGEINGLIDGWRLDDASRSTRQRVKRFDRRVGDALVVAFAEDVGTAATLLAGIKQSITDLRMSTARLQYLLAASLGSFFFLLLMSAIKRSCTSDNAIILMNAATAGAFGAFFSISWGIRTRDVRTDLYWRENAVEAALRVVIGVISAAVLMAFVLTKAVTLSLGEAKYDDVATRGVYVLIIGFLAGFAERLVPNILQTFAAQADPPAPTPRSPDTTRQPGHVAGATDSDATSSAADPNTPSSDPSSVQPDADAHVDGCPCDAGSSGANPTKDSDLPPASGGVAAPAVTS